MMYQKNKSELVWAVTLSVTLAFLAMPSLALDLNLPDRLKAPAKHFDHVENNAFLAIERVENRLVAVGERGVIIYSDDDGESWRQANVPISTLMTALDFSAKDNAWAVGHSGSILQSVNQGENWSLVLEGNEINALLVKQAELAVKEANTLYLNADEYDKEDLQYALEDAEFALSNAKFDRELGPANPFLDILFISELKGFAVGAYGLFVNTEDGGKSWQSAAHRLENFDRYHLNAIAMIKGGALLIAGEAGTLFASYDQGQTWETLYGPYQGSYFGIQPLANDDQALLYGLKGHVFKTEDAGQTWQNVATQVETSLTSSVISASNDIVIAGLSGVVLVSDDHGETFSHIETKGYEGFNGVTVLETGDLMLVSDEGVQFLALP